MRLTDIMSGADLHHYAQIALLLFAATFAVILWSVLSRRNTAVYDQVSQLPLRLPHAGSSTQSDEHPVDTDDEATHE